MTQDFWPPALTPQEEIIFAGSIPRDATEEQILDVALAEKRRRLNRRDRQEVPSQDVGYSLVAVPIHPCEQSPEIEQPARASATSPRPLDGSFTLRSKELFSPFPRRAAENTP
jgi:hypothetical protein